MMYLPGDDTELLRDRPLLGSCAASPASEAAPALLPERCTPEHDAQLLCTSSCASFSGTAAQGTDIHSNSHIHHADHSGLPAICGCQMLFTACGKCVDVAVLLSGAVMKQRQQEVTLANL